MSRTFTLAVERVADDRRFAERFRHDPQRALRRYRLDDDQLDAIKSGEFAPLAHHGLDVQQFQDGKRHGWRPYWRRALVGVSVLGATLGLMGTPASAAIDVCGKEFCPQISGIRKASLRQARNGRAIRIGMVLIRRSSIREGLRRNGFRAGPGRVGIRATLRQFCGRYARDGQECVLDGPDFAEPLVLAEAP